MGSEDAATATKALHVRQEVARIAQDHFKKGPENMGGDRSIEVSSMSTRPHASMYLCEA
jgi:hypothetical protein